VRLPLERLEAGALEILGRALTDNETAQFVNYSDLLVKWQLVHRLVGSTDPDWVVSHLFLDSLLFLRILPAGTREVLDLGAGAGFPGLPLRIVSPEMLLTLIEARRRRVSFLSTVVRELGLGGVQVIGARAEEVARELAERFDAVVMRCAGPPDAMLSLGRRFARPGGVVLATASLEARPSALGRRITVPGAGRAGGRAFVVLDVVDRACQ
jgi:16S rRNA (guanine527-N7)-methyltransferase